MTLFQGFLQRRAALAATALLFAAYATPTSAATYNATLRIDTTVTHQYVRGFGGFAFSAQWGVNLSDSEIETMYGKGSKQLGYNIMRARICPDEYASWGADNWASTAAIIKKCRAQGCEVFASAWTPPGAYTSNGENIGGHILPEHFGDYATFLNRFVDRMVSEGADVDYISLQNEPDWEPTYEGCIWYACHFIDFYTNYAPTVKRPMIGPESLSFRRALSDSILQNDAACANLAVVGGHLYGGGNFDYPLVREKGKEKWMTEYLINHGDDDTTTPYTFDDALTFARVVNTSMLANYSVWCHYALKSAYGMIGDGTCGTTSGAVTKRGYALSHFAKYVSGTTRVDHQLTDPNFGLTASAYVTPSGDSLVVMLINTTTSTYNVRYDLPFQIKNYRRIVTTSSKNMTITSGSVDAESATPVISIPAKTIATYILVRSSDRTDAQSAVEPPLFADEWEQYNGECVIPKGWKVTYKGSAVTGTGQTVSFWDGSKPRLFPYSPESPIHEGLLLSASSSSKDGIANYGSNSAYRLKLEPGNYRLIWHAVGWEHAQKLFCYVRRSGTTTNVAYHSNVDVPAHVGGTWGSAQDCFDATADTLDFTVTTAGNYELNWKVTYYADNAVSSLCQALVGGIRLEQLPAADDNTSAIDLLPMDDASTRTVRTEFYDLNGRRQTTASKGLYLRRSISADGKSRTQIVQE
jgi:O-glycosyl hydrolase